MADKTIKQLAEEYKITKQAINYHIKKLSKDTIKFDSKGCKLISEKGQQELAKILSKDVAKEVSNFDSKAFDTLIEQLKVKDEQIKELQKLLDQEQQLNAINQKKIEALEDKQNNFDTKQSVWSKLFGKNKATE